MRVIQEMNYHPSAVARGLSKKRVHSIGVLFGQIDPSICLYDPYMIGVLAGVMSRAQRDGFIVSLFTQRWQSASQSALPLRDGRTDGILALAPPLDSGMIEGVEDLGVPIVAIAGTRKEGITAVDIDSYAGARLATEHLLGLGHRRIAYLSAGVNLSCYEPRLAGYSDALKEVGIEVDVDLIKLSCFSESLSYEDTRVLLALPEPPTAIFAGNDLSARGVFEAARALGISIPHQLSLVGFDDVPMARDLSPALTTVRQPLHAIGETAATLLIEQITQPDSNRKSKLELLMPELIVRESTAPCPISVGIN
jgi:LacI family transcriptional regulator